MCKKRDTIKHNESCSPSNLQTHFHFKPDFRKVDQDTGGKWVIRDTKYHKDNQLQSPELPVEYPVKNLNMA